MNLKIYAQLSAIQAELKAPKSQYNEFGKYKYRKAEDILEAVKPLLKKYNCALFCTDDLVLVGDRYYIKATASIVCTEDGSEVTATAYAREEQDKKGMDQSQVTGASSSYARKYALNGLLCIDDTADSDTTNVGDGKAATAKQRGTAGKKADKAADAQQQDANAALYAKWVEAIAKGIRTKQGQDPREAFIAYYKPSPDQQDRLDYDVYNYRMDNNIKAE